MPKIIVTDENCSVCETIKKHLKNDNSFRFVDIKSSEGKILDKKFNIKEVPFGTNGIKKCKLMTNKKKDIILQCSK